MIITPVHGALFGVAIGDALGVPAEFTNRSTLRQDPVTDFIGFKSHGQPPGTFSDDSSLTFCLAESLCLGYDLNDAGKRFVMWYDEHYWTAGNEVFDIGNTTRNAIYRLRRGTKPSLAGDFDEGCNGNGSLMRIMPLLFYIRDFEIEKRYDIIKEVSSMTHGHIRSVIACFYYLEYALELLKGSDKQTAYANTAKSVHAFIVNKQIIRDEVNLFSPLLQEDITKRDIDSIPSRGYVMNTLQASMYCFLTTDNYQDATLMAVNLGNDSDTTAAVTGGLAGLYYGFDSIPEKWRHEVKRSNDIKDLCDRLAKAMGL
ncbi:MULTISPECIES: ADP-ribosylglycohydrolase family protein [Niastella]|uniref:ADP-ribosylglycohydrolase family protein n=1 Tax=Niastella soli TaxID=2821487 RepID=A0ABS3YPB3_9BACT|nr:ADP-ribosylglycohydrolase family protein [Niastella soli]MBO9199315.1 ADP-ribosylglycohydrolase family protein [Niastella soli]